MMIMMADNLERLGFSKATMEVDPTEMKMMKTPLDG